MDMNKIKNERNVKYFHVFGLPFGFWNFQIMISWAFCKSEQV